MGGNDWLNQLQACMAAGKPVLLRDFNDARNATLVDLLQMRVRGMPNTGLKRHTVSSAINMLTCTCAGTDGPSQRISSSHHLCSMLAGAISSTHTSELHRRQHKC